MDQQRFAGPELAQLKHVEPNGEKCLGQGCSVHGAQADGDREALRGRGHGVFGIAAAGQQRADGVAGLPPVYVGTQRLDRAGDLQARDRRDTRTQRVATRGLQHIGAIQARSRDFNQDLARAGRGDGRFDDAKLAAGLNDFDLSHLFHSSHLLQKTHLFSRQ